MKKLDFKSLTTFIVALAMMVMTAALNPARADEDPFGIDLHRLLFEEPFAREDVLNAGFADAEIDDVVGQGVVQIHRHFAQQRHRRIP